MVASDNDNGTWLANTGSFDKCVKIWSTDGNVASIQVTNSNMFLKKDLMQYFKNSYTYTKFHDVLHFQEINILDCCILEEEMGAQTTDGYTGIRWILIDH